MNKRKKLKLAIASACASTGALEQLINLSPASFALQSPRLTSTQCRRQERHLEEEEDELSSLFFHTAVLSCSLGLTDDDAGWWVKPRLPAWFDKFLLEVNDRESWFNAFRMSKETFLYICSQLQPLLNKKVTHFREPIPVPWRLGAALYRLTNGSDMQIISEKFGIGVSSTQGCIIDTVRAINQHFKGSVSFPQGDSLQQVVSGFVDKCELLNCAGAIGATSIQLMPSSDSTTCFMSLQGVCDTSYRFLDVYFGSSRDAHHPLGPGLVKAAGLLSAATEAQGSMHYLVGDDGFPLLPWLLVRYQDDSDTPIMGESFNRRHALGMMHVKVSFGILKDTFKVLSKCVKHGVSFVPSLVSACCILHNVLLDRNEIPVDSLLQGLLSGVGEAEVPVNACEYGTEEEQQGQELRDHLAEMFFRRDL